MNEENGIGKCKPKQSRRQGESAPELPVGRAYGVEPLAASKVLIWKQELALINLFTRINCQCKERLTSSLSLKILIASQMTTKFHFSIYSLLFKFIINKH